MDLLCPLSRAYSWNGSTPKDTLGKLKKMHLPATHDIAKFVHRAEIGAYLYSAGIVRAYRQLTLDPADWLLLCFRFEGRFFTDVSVSFYLRWAASHCQVVTRLI